MDIPSNHQGIPLPPRKNSDVFFPAVRDATHPMLNTIKKKMLIITQSSVDSAIFLISKAANIQIN